MEGKIRSFVALLAILMLVVTLVPLADTELVTAAPSLDTWEVVTIPSATGNVISQCDVTDMAVAPDSTTIYVCDAQGSRFLKSVDGGHCFDDITAGLVGVDYVGPPRLVAVAPDNPDVVIVSDSANPEVVFLTNNGGITWTNIGSPGTVAETLTDIALSPAIPDTMLGRYFFATVADDTAGAVTTGDVMELGTPAAGTDWAPAGSGLVTGTHDYMAIECTPNFVFDRSVCVVGVTALGAVDHQILNISIPMIVRTTTFVPAGTTVDFDAALTGAGEIVCADVTLPSDFDATSIVGERAYVCLGSNPAQTTDDVYRIDGAAFHKLEGVTAVAVQSVSFSGTIGGGTLFLGEHANPNVRYSTDPAALIPTWTNSAKPPTGQVNALTIVMVSPDYATSSKVFAGTSDTAAVGESAFSVSTNGGFCFNQWSLIDTTITGMSDVMPTPDGTEIFLATWNSAGTDLESLWKSPLPTSPCSWERVGTSPTNWGDAGGETIIRLSPEYGTDGTIFWCDRNGTEIQHSPDGGCVFFARAAESSIQDVTVEDLDTLYAACGDNNVYKSDSAAWTWLAPPDIANVGFDIWTIAMAPTYPIMPEPDTVLVGGTSGEVAYIKWTTLPPSPTSLPTLHVGGNVQVAGDTNYASTHAIYAGSNNGNVFRYFIPGGPWDLINPTIANVSGLAVHCGWLYAADATPGGGVYRTSDPLATPPGWVHLVSGLSGSERFNTPPSALRCSDGLGDVNYIALFAIDTVNTVLYEYIDFKVVEPPIIPPPPDGDDGILEGLLWVMVFVPLVLVVGAALGIWLWWRARRRVTRRAKRRKKT